MKQGRKGKDTLPSQEQVDKFKMLSSLLDSIYDEMKEFSKKKPDELLNKLKVKMINRVLEQIKALLSGEPTVSFLEPLDEATLPSNSDAVLILGQFRSSMSQFTGKFHRYDESIHRSRWHTQENP
jgi:hypothetical protein